jgi:hypothetical protein
LDCCLTLRPIVLFFLYLSHASRQVSRDWRTPGMNNSARQIRDEFESETWDAFWQTAVQGRKVSDVSRLLGKTAGAIYTARSHVMRRLKQKVLEWEAGE